MGAATEPDNADFSVVRHGFDRGQVRSRLAALTEAAARAARERAEAAEQVAELRGELEIARREIAALSERLDAQTDEESATRVLAVAKSQAAEVTARAKVAAEQTWAGAEQASTELRNRYRQLLSDLDAQHATLSATHKDMMTSAKAQVAEMTEAADQRREAIEKEAERDRVRIDREFSESMATKREALRREIDTARTTSEQEAAARLAAADEEAKRRVDAVNGQVTRLSKVRDTLSGRLRETKELLDVSVALLEPVEGEQDVAEPAAAEPARAVPPQRESKRQPAKR
jgi:colicin import membrane protein